MTSPKIKIEKLCTTFGNKKVLSNLDLEVKEGKSLVILGGSGSGKSVLIKNISGLMKPTSGSIKIDDLEVVNIKEKQRYQLMDKMGFLFQQGALFDSLTVWENICFNLLYNKKISKKEARDIAALKLSQVKLATNVMNLKPSALSGGMQKRVALARAIVGEPQIIFFDEPTTGLDPIMCDAISHLIVECSKKLNATTITITHDMRAAQTIADNVAFLYQGNIFWHGSAKDMYNSGNEYLDQFVNGHEDGPITF